MIWMIGLIEIFRLVEQDDYLISQSQEKGFAIRSVDLSELYRFVSFTASHKKMFIKPYGRQNELTLTNMS